MNLQYSIWIWFSLNFSLPYLLSTFSFCLKFKSFMIMVLLFPPLLFDHMSSLNYYFFNCLKSQFFLPENFYQHFTFLCIFFFDAHQLQIISSQPFSNFAICSFLFISCWITFALLCCSCSQLLVFLFLLFLSWFWFHTSILLCFHGTCSVRGDWRHINAVRYHPIKFESVVGSMIGWSRKWPSKYKLVAKMQIGCWITKRFWNYEWTVQLGKPHLNKASLRPSFRLVSSSNKPWYLPFWSVNSCKPSICNIHLK